MRVLIAVITVACMVAAQEPSKPAAPPALAPGARATENEIVIPAGTKIPISLKNAISTKGNHQGDPVYAQTTFPVVVNDHIVIPAGTYLQGRIMQIKPAGRIKNRAEVMMHFTTLIYPNGYTVILPGSLENAPDVEKAKVKDKEGTIKADSDKGSKAAKVAIPAAEGGAMAGGIASGTRSGVAMGAGLGAAAGIGLAMLTKGNEVRLPPGTTLEVVMQRDVPVNADRIKSSSMADSR
jgi:type IV secretion system protein VirB10